MVFFDKTICIRIRKKDWEDIKAVVRENPEVYDNESHFIRASVIKEINKLKG